MNWINVNSQPFPDSEGWYLVLYKFEDGAVLPITLYYHFSWIVPSALYGTIEFYTEIENTPVPLKDGKLF
jgi:hypothetical protein